MAVPDEGSRAARAARECWRWPVGKPTKEGRPRLRWGLVYRVMYLMLVDPDLSPDLDLHHECRNAWCVNPWHLTPMTRSEHIRLHRRLRPRKTTCVNGHDLTDPSIGIWTTRKSGPRAGQPERYCRLCIRDWKRRKRAAR